LTAEMYNTFLCITGNICQAPSTLYIRDDSLIPFTKQKHVVLVTAHAFLYISCSVLLVVDMAARLGMSSAPHSFGGSTG